MFETLRKLITEQLNISPGCSLCEYGRVKIPYADGRIGYKFEYCDCRKQYKQLKKLISLYKKANIPFAALSVYDPENYTESAVSLTALKLFSDGRAKAPWLYLSGKPGTGKTYTAMVALFFALGSFKKVLYVNTPRLLDSLRPGIDQETGQQLMKLCIECEFLVLDDIGQEKVSDWVRERLYIIINERYMARRQTIFTSNLSMEDLKIKLDHPALISRIKHLSVPVTFSAELDRRTPIYSLPENQCEQRL